LHCILANQASGRFVRDPLTHVVAALLKTLEPNPHIDSQNVKNQRGSSF
jgi:hypothetical protein